MNRNSLFPHFFNTVILASSDSSGQKGSKGLEPQLHFLKRRNTSEVRKTPGSDATDPDTGKAGPAGTCVWGWGLGALAMAESRGSCCPVTAQWPSAAVFCSRSSALVPCVVPTNALLLIFL